MKLINRCSSPSVKILGLTATAFEIISKNGFFSDMPIENCIIYDIMEAMADKSICGLNIHIIRFDFKIHKDMYRQDGNLTHNGELFVRSKIHSAKKVEDVLSECSGKTMIISIPKQDRDICDHINLRFGNGSSVLNSMKNEYCDDAEKEFVNNDNVKFMTVINKCGVGWDFPELQNVVDTTFTQSISLIIQRMLRPCRNSKKIENKTGNYFYCCDQTHDISEIRNRIGNAVLLAKRDGILAYRQNPGIDLKGYFPNNALSVGGGDRDKINVENWLVDYELQ